MYVLVVNSGSSSIKYQVIDSDDERIIAKGLITHIVPDAPNSSGASPLKGTKNHEEGLAELFDELEVAGIGKTGHPLGAVGHRVVHGGPHFSSPVLIDDEVCSAITEQFPLAPLHNPANLAGIVAARRRAPELPQVAVFDTAFHHTIPAVAATYAIPTDLARQHVIKRYGFHGTNCAWCLTCAAEHLRLDRTGLNLIVAHLGAGASVTAIREGCSADTSMGLSPLEGLMMQTRCGDIDPAILLLLLRAGMSPSTLDHLLNYQSGIMGICGESDMLAVSRRGEAGDRDALFAREMYTYRAAKYVNSYLGVASPLHALIFTGGVGEHDSWVRARICADLQFAGLRVDADANRMVSEEFRSIAAKNSSAEILVIPANEELQIARETLAVLQKARGIDG